MANAETILFLDDDMHISKATPVMTSSATDPGYHRDNVRDTNLATAWKGVDSTTADVWLQVDGGSATWVGGLGAQVFCAIAYDSRNNEQDSLNLNHDDADNPAMTAQTTDTTFTLVKNGTGPVVQWASFTGLGKRHYRLLAPGGARSEAAGSKVPKIYAWAMFRPGGVYNINTEYGQDSIDAGSFEVRSKVARLETAGGLMFTNRFGSTDQGFDLTFKPASVDLWEDLRDALIALDNDHRAFFMQYGGIRSAGTAESGMVRLRSGSWRAERFYRDSYDMEIPIVTEPYRA